MFDIEINYTIGNSFNNESRIEPLGNPVTDIDMVKENLRRIKTHYERKKENPNYGKSYELELLTDHGKRTISPFWIGYFESLQSIRVIVEESIDTFHEFY